VQHRRGGGFAEDWGTRFTRETGRRGAEHEISNKNKVARKHPNLLMIFMFAQEKMLKFLPLLTMLACLMSGSCSSNNATAVASINVFVSGERLTLTTNQPYHVTLKESHFINVHVRSGAGVNYPSRGVIYDGTVVEVTGSAIDNGGTQWLPIVVKTDSNELHGFIAARYLSKLEPT